jgi:hypothetical protein
MKTRETAAESNKFIRFIKTETHPVRPKRLQKNPGDNLFNYVSARPHIVIDHMSIDVANCLQVESYVTLGRKGSGDRDRTTFSIEVSTPTSSTGDLL